MNRAFLLALLAALLVGLVSARVLTATTNISGSIDVPTVWTRTNSPYLIVDTATLSEQISLAIMPGVEVYFLQDAVLDLSLGELVAPGGKNDEIIFSSIDYDDGGEPKGEMRLGTASIAHAVIAGLKAIDGHASDGVSFNRCVFEGCENALDHFNNLIVDQCQFLENSYAISSVNGCGITGTVFAGNNEGTIDGSGINILNSKLSGSKVCVDSATSADDVPLQVTNSTLSGCLIAFRVAENSTNAQIQFNNLSGNDLNVQGHFMGSLAANWWGTTDTNKALATVKLDPTSPSAAKIVNPIAQAPYDQKI